MEAKELVRRPPTHVAQHGGVRAAVWENAGEGDLTYSIRITRSYRVDNVWYETTNMGHAELISVAKVALEAHSWIAKTRRARRSTMPPILRSEEAAVETADEPEPPSDAQFNGTGPPRPWK